MDVVIDRNYQNEEQTVGTLSIYEEKDMVFRCFTIELPWKDNKTGVSRIPTGKYRVTKYNSPSKGKVFLFHDVQNRSYIEIHSGNFVSQIRGCILVGDNLRDINNDGLRDVLNSRKTMDKLYELLPDEFNVKIFDCF